MLPVRKYVPWVSIAIVFTLLLLQNFFSADTGAKLAFTGYVIIVWISALGIASDARPYSINKIFWIFNLFFFGIMPAYQFTVNTFPWFQHFDGKTCARTNWLIISSMLAYALVYSFLRKRKVKKESAQRNLPESFLKNYLSIGTIIFAIACISIIWAIGFDHLWLRRLTRDAELRMNSTVQLIFDKTIRGVILYFTLLSIWLYRNKKINLARLLIILIACIIVNFPAALPRYFTATLYGSMALAFRSKWLNKQNTFSILLSALLLIAFPLFSITRYTFKEASFKLTHPAQIVRETFTYGEFDPYATTCRTMNFVNQNGTTHGKQLAGVLLFFVPRSMWHNKPVGSGMTVYPTPLIGSEFRNIASPLYAEGFINFGWAGSIVFVIIFSVLISLYDNYFWNRRENDLFLYLLLFYPVAIFMAFFIMRGDLLSSFAFTTGFFISGLVFHKLLSMNFSRFSKCK